jgi:HlyD family secretion protein
LAKLKAGPSETELAAAEAALKAAQDALATLQAGPREAELAAARAALNAAQANYDLLTSQPSPEVIRQAELKVEFAKNALWQAQSQRDAACGSDRASKSTCDSFEAAVGNAHVQIEQANLALEQAKSPATQAEIQSALSQVQLAQRNLDSLLAGPTAAEIAAAEAQIAQAQAQLDRLTTGPSPEDLQIAETRVKQADLALQQARKNLAGAILKAPFDGVVTAVNYRVGDVVRPERPGISLADLSLLEIRVNVAEIDISQVQIGQEAEIVLDALPDQIIAGQVIQIAPAARSELGVVNYPVAISLATNDPGVKPGLTGNVNIITGQRENVLLVPNRAIRGSKGQYLVAVLRDDQLVELPVQIGLSNDSITEIVSGLEEGDQVVLNITTIQSGLSGGLFSGQR